MKEIEKLVLSCRKVN